MKTTTASGRVDTPAPENRDSIVRVARSRQIVGAIGVAAGVIVSLLPVPVGLTRAAMLNFGGIVWAVISWATRTLPSFVTAIILAVFWLVVLRLPASTVLGSFSGTTEWLLLSALVFIVALEKTGLALRVSRWLVNRLPHTHAGRVLSLVLCGILFGPVVPDAIAKVSMLGPIAVDIGEESGYGPQSKAMAGLTLGCWLGIMPLGSVLFMTGSAANLAIMDRFACYIPGWEMPKNSSEYLTQNYGFITDYLAEAFHYEFKHTNRYEEVSKRIHLGRSVEGRDEDGIKKMVCAFLKILHPGVAPSDEEFEEYVACAVEYRRRVKEQMNKRKPDDEFANIGLSYIDSAGKEVVVFCPESKDAAATQSPARRHLRGAKNQVLAPTTQVPLTTAPVAPPLAASTVPLVEIVPTPDIVRPVQETPQEQHYQILYGDTGHTYESILGPYLPGCTAVTIEDAYIRAPYQIQNFVRFCETAVKAGTVHKITLITGNGDEGQRAEAEENWKNCGRACSRWTSI